GPAERYLVTIPPQGNILLSKRPNRGGDGKCQAGIVSIISSSSAPGSGKSRLARRLTTLLPAISLADARETTRIDRVAGLTRGRIAVVTTRPFRAPTTPSPMWA